jgi:hypothetical protein
MQQPEVIAYIEKVKKASKVIRKACAEFNEKVRGKH